MEGTVHRLVIRHTFIAVLRSQFVMESCAGHHFDCEKFGLARGGQS